MIRCSEFVFDYFNLLYEKCQKINPNRGGSYIDSSDWIKNKKVSKSPINKKYKCFQYAVTVALNHEQIGKDPERILKIKPFKNEYTWEKIHFLPEKGDWKKFQKNNVKLLLMFCVLQTKNISC